MAQTGQNRRADRIGEQRTALDKNRKIILATQRVCAICGREVDFSFKYPHPQSPSVDHIIPISQGGHPSDLSNLQLAHRWCNRMKSDKLYVPMARQDDNADIGNDDLPQHFDWKKYKSN